MGGSMQALLGVTIGGVITLATTLVVDRFRFRRERQNHWDDERLEAMTEFIAAANRAISAPNDKGTRLARGDRGSTRGNVHMAPRTLHSGRQRSQVADPPAEASAAS
jgi:hypothetical protein